jgi:SPP1 family predicted phage head-tail adaptor
MVTQTSISAGSLSTRVTVQRLVASTDTLGQPINSWQDFQTVWADVRFPSGLQNITVHADKPFAKQRVSVRLRQDFCSKKIEAGMRVVINNKPYLIASAEPQGRFAIDLVCEAM